jgi:hypothetical protein
MIFKQNAGRLKRKPLSPEDLRELCEQRSVNIQRRGPELVRKDGTMIDPSFQRCGAIDVRMPDQDLPDLTAAQDAGLPSSYLAQRTPTHLLEETRVLTAPPKITLGPFSFWSDTNDTSSEPREVHLSIGTPNAVKNPSCALPLDNAALGPAGSRSSESS